MRRKARLAIFPSERAGRPQLVGPVDGESRRTGARSRCTDLDGVGEHGPYEDLRATGCGCLDLPALANHAVPASPSVLGRPATRDGDLVRERGADDREAWPEQVGARVEPLLPGQRRVLGTDWFTGGLHAPHGGCRRGGGALSRLAGGDGEAARPLQGAPPKRIGLAARGVVRREWWGCLTQSRPRRAPLAARGRAWRTRVESLLRCNWLFR